MCADHPKKGNVLLVGAGPGDPELITLKAKRALEEAEVVVYDHLVNEELLSFCSPHCELIYVGKRAGAHTLQQDDINRLLVDKAKEGKFVVRLKGGDPFIFGRGGEEAEHLHDQGIPFEVVPAVSSAIAAPAYAGIPLTHRGLSSSVTIVTGQQGLKKPHPNIHWEHLAKASDTLVFLMGVRNLQHIVRELISNGRSPQEPSSLIQWGTTPRQRTIVGPLQTIPSKARAAQIEPPAVLVIGEVVRLRNSLKWFETRPLFGKKILVTRTMEQAKQFTYRLRELGAEAVEFPTIRIEGPRNCGVLDGVMEQLDQYDWIVFTSPNGVIFFLKRLFERARDIRDLKGPRIAAIGPSTAGTIEEFGVSVDLVPSEFKAESLAKALCEQGVRGKRILIPRAEEAREVLPRRLRKAGAVVDVAPTYRTMLPQDRCRQLKELLSESSIDVVTFTSSSAARNFVEMIGWPETKELLKGTTIACIGPITARTARRMGMRPHVVAKTYTIEGLIDALIDHFSRERQQEDDRNL